MASCMRPREAGDSVRTLYVSDLDGTLLGGDGRLSRYAVDALNRLIGGGMLFAYATARSFATAAKVTRGIRMSLPAIVYNGTFIVDGLSGERLLSNTLDKGFVADAADFLGRRGVRALVYAFVDGVERVSWLRGGVNDGIAEYIASRAGDPRLREAATPAELFAGEVFYITCVGEREEMLAVRDEYAPRSDCNLTLTQESGRAWWCELMSPAASKGSAVLRLKAMLGADRVVAFGDQVNDLPLFAAADECYAVANAAPRLKAAATGVVGPNDGDGVVRWLEERRARP